MNDFDRIEAIRIRALRAVWRPDHEALMRRIFRWYSEKYHTPLHLVQDLPEEDILQTWFEVQYQELPPEERHNLAIFLLEDESERRAREADNKNSDEEFYLRTQQKALEQKKKGDLKSRVAEMKKRLEALAGQKNPPDHFKTVTKKPMKELELYQPKEEEVVVMHVDEEFEDIDPMAPPKKR